MVKQDQFILLNITEFEEWLKALRISRTIKVIQQHHTWRPNYKQFKGNNEFEMVKSMKRYHMSNGSSDIAQNITIFPNGKIMICRPLNIAPAGIKGVNSYGICIENIGDFDKGKDVMNDVHKNSILTVSALLCKKFNLTPSTNSIVYHHWYDMDSGLRTNGSGNVKSCPGTNFFGGNSVDAANKYFIPLIKNKLNGTPTIVNVIITSHSKVNYCLEWQKWYNAQTKTTTPLACDGIYGKNTQISLDALLGYIEQSKKYKYCLEFQKLYNSLVKPSVKLTEDGYWGNNSEIAFKKLNELIKG